MKTEAIFRYFRKQLLKNLSKNIPGSTQASFSDVIDIKRLENENRKVLIAGFMAAILILAGIDPFIDGKSRVVETQTDQRTFRLPITIVMIPRKALQQESPSPPEARPHEESAAKSTDTITVSHQRDTVEQHVTAIPDKSENALPEERKTPSLLFQPPPDRKLPSLAETAPDSGYTAEKGLKIDYLHIPYAAPDSGFSTPNFWNYHATIPLGENTAAIVGPGYGVIYYDPFPDKEEVEDERRQFKYDILGIPIGGKGLAFGVGLGAVFLDVGGVINSGRHTLKGVVWKIEDWVKDGRIQTQRTGGFSQITEKDIRFMILLWRYDRIDPRKMTRKDRLFIVKAKMTEITTNNRYLDTMEKRGLATSLKKKGRLVYKANFPRDEILHTFIAAYGAVKEPETKTTVLSYITLINSN